MLNGGRETFGNTSCLVSMAAAWTSILGILTVCWTLREVFTDLFQPSASGSLSSFVSRTLFRFGKRAHWMLGTAGPLTIVVVIFCWAMLVSIGFAFIFWARFPEAFANTSAEHQDVMGRFWSVLYFSLANLSTVGSTEFTPNGNWIRIVASLESLIGISLLTASITWIVLVYPALGRMRTLARRASTLSRAQEQTGVDLLAGDIESLLGDLAVSVLRTRVDFIHFPIIYYFHADTEGASLGRFLLRLDDLAGRASKQERPERIRLGAALLQLSLEDLAQVLAERFMPGKDLNDARAVFEAVSKDHLEHEREGRKKEDRVS
jgi:hypothetical protein